MAAGILGWKLLPREKDVSLPNLEDQRNFSKMTLRWSPLSNAILMELYEYVLLGRLHTTRKSLLIKSSILWQIAHKMTFEAKITFSVNPKNLGMY